MKPRYCVERNPPGPFFQRGRVAGSSHNPPVRRRDESPKSSLSPPLRKGALGGFGKRLAWKQVVARRRHPDR